MWPCSSEGGIAGTIPALEDAALANELARARNTWVAEYCAENPARLKGTAVLPQQDIRRRQWLSLDAL